METAAAARAWVEAWERAWPAGDASRLADVYAPEAVFYSHPFRHVLAPSDYATWAFGEQASAVCRFGEPVVAGDRAVVDWWAVIADHDGGEETLAGVSLLRFDASGRAVEQRDVWASEPGRHDLPHWAV